MNCDLLRKIMIQTVHFLTPPFTKLRHHITDKRNTRFVHLSTPSMESALANDFLAASDKGTRISFVENPRTVSWITTSSFVSRSSTMYTSAIPVLTKPSVMSGSRNPFPHRVVSILPYDGVIPVFPLVHEDACTNASLPLLLNTLTSLLTLATARSNP